MRIIGPPFSEEEKRAVIQAARALLGKPWGHQARGPRRYDCLGLLGASVAAVRHVPPLPNNYGRLPFDRRLFKQMVGWLGEPVDRAPAPGDIVTMAWVGEENHVALVTDHPHGLGMIHSYPDAPGLAGGRVVEHGIDAQWLRRVNQVFAL